MRRTRLEIRRAWPAAFGFVGLSLGCATDPPGEDPPTGDDAALADSIPRDSVSDSVSGSDSDAGSDSAPLDAGPSRAALTDLQGDLMLWVPSVKPDCTTGQDPVTRIRCAADTGQIPRGVLAGWVWSVTVDRYPKDQREKIYQAAIDAGYTHFALHVARCVPGDGYHGLYPTTADDCAKAGAQLNTVLHELVAHRLVPFCAGVSPTDPPAEGLDRTLCPIAMTDWDNSDQADCRIQAVSEAFPKSLVYYELPEGAITPKPDACSPVPFPASGAEWIKTVQAKHPNFVGVFYEINQPDGLDANAAQLTKTHAFWGSTQEVRGEIDTYWKFWENLDPSAERTYNDKLQERAPWLRGFMSGGTTHKAAP